MGTIAVTSQLAPLTSLSTPALVVDLDVFEANVAAMATLLRGTGKTIRPHVKTHRTPELARRQLGGAAVGVTCATVGEAEAMVEAGIDDVLIANEVVDPRKIARLVALGRRARIAVAVDDPEPVATLSVEAARAGTTIDVLIDVDILLHRCGVPSAGDAVSLAQVIDRAPGVRLRGIMGYEGRLRLKDQDRAARIAQAYATLAEARAALLDAGFPVEVVSSAGTSTVPDALANPIVTEVQAGVYALMEPELLNLDLPFRCAVAIRGTVISRHPGRIVLDLGRRVVGMEYGAPVPVGFVATRIAISDEHATIHMADPLPALGSELDLAPGQIRTTFNLHDHVWVKRDGRLIDRWPITARGSSQ
ncbi:MAG TPA: alanine racemase [Candidatus Limnocylindrales bacterium]|nr:alanine racemase [Candidatus Limnocylindrales bacterium]